MNNQYYSYDYAYLQFVNEDIMKASNNISFTDFWDTTTALWAEAEFKGFKDINIETILFSINSVSQGSGLDDARLINAIAKIENELEKHGLNIDIVREPDKNYKYEIEYRIENGEGRGGTNSILTTDESEWSKSFVRINSGMEYSEVIESLLHETMHALGHGHPFHHTTNEPQGEASHRDAIINTQSVHGNPATQTLLAATAEVLWNHLEDIPLNINSTNTFYNFSPEDALGFVELTETEYKFGNHFAENIIDQDGIDTIYTGHRNGFNPMDQIININLGGISFILQNNFYVFSDYVSTVTIMNTVNVGTKTFGGSIIENVISGHGNDFIYGNSSANEIQSGEGNDTIFSNGGLDTIKGEGGNDYIYGGFAVDLNNNDIFGENYFDINGSEIHESENLDINNSANAAITLYGGNGHDYLVGGRNKDYLYGESDNDTILGSVGSDNIYGDDEENVLSGDDSLLGQGGNDTVYGGKGEDSLFGGSNNDSLYGGDGYDEINGEEDVDTIYGGNNDDLIYGGSDSDKLYGDSNNDEMHGYHGNDTLYGGTGVDDLFGGVWADTLEGGSDSDFLYGGQSNDLIKGETGNDHLYGGQGTDNLYGGSGSDKFIFRFNEGTTATIHDFSTLEGDKVLIGFNSVSNPTWTISGTGTTTIFDLSWNAGTSKIIVYGLEYVGLNPNLDWQFGYF